jgi:nucleoside-diphosphate-sugar epimerase
LVTGASGFIGVHLVHRLRARGDRVVCLVRATSRVDALRAAGAELIVGCVNDRAAINSAIARSKPRVVFHLAGLVRANNLEDFMEVNSRGVESVAATCAEQVNPPVLLLVSSLAAAGPVVGGGGPKLERDAPSPVSNYGRSKLAGEHAAKKYAAEVPITIVRPCVVFGPGDRAVYEMFKPINRFNVHLVPRRGDRRVSFIAVEDLVELIVIGAERGERLVPSEAEGTVARNGVKSEFQGCGLYFVAAESLSYVELGNAIARSLGRECPRTICLPGWILRVMGSCGDIVSRMRNRPAWLNSDKVSEALAGSWTCSSEKARQQLGWSPAQPLADRLRETSHWYRKTGWL